MNRRLDSWKAIAEYLGRDTATARRWEKTLGLPVHRVAGGVGRSVFAYTAEIDAWLAASPRVPAAGGDTAAPPQPPSTDIAAADAASFIDRVDVVVPPAARRRGAFAAVAVVALLGTAWWAAAGRAATGPLHVTVDDRRAIARSDNGKEVWRYEFPSGTRTAWPAFGASVLVVDDANPTVYLATSHRFQLAEGPTEGGELLALDAAGRRQRGFSFDDEITLGGKTYTAPWVITDFALRGSGASRQIAVSSHHYLWSPSIVTVLDQSWRRGGRFVNDGWIETLEWAGPQRLVAGGFDQAHDAALAVLIDTASMQPLRMVVMPRSEINVVTASRFNRAIIEVVNERVIARTVEMPDEVSQGAIDGIYEFTPSLELTRASYGGRYWEMHRSLEAQGKLKHTQAACPDRNGPREVLVWEPSTGWRTRATGR